MSINITTTKTCAYKLTDYGIELQTNKAFLEMACTAAGITDNDIKCLLLSMAMLETNTLDVNDRDASKDGSHGAANVSIFNLNMDMIHRLGYTDDSEFLNEPYNLSIVVRILWDALYTWGIDQTLDFIRGGYVGFMDGVSYGCQDYRNTIGTIYNVIRNDPSLLVDSRRVEIYLEHV